MKNVDIVYHVLSTVSFGHTLPTPAAPPWVVKGAVALKPNHESQP